MTITAVPPLTATSSQPECMDSRALSTIHFNCSRNNKAKVLKTSFRHRSIERDIAAYLRHCDPRHSRGGEKSGFSFENFNSLIDKYRS
ncbi:hypothetical protein CDAR_408531 [Caerostris darwini]|uniref:Uncharacterized protein n=1 Tax=Caerostris darwini TaxID=1538125 RepID=A0AAV4X612_9ARAC|nr:hypothetical protein CDAR_408531 [Caerostris darwini]